MSFRLKLEALGDKDPGLLDLDSDSEEAGPKSTELGTQAALPTLPNSEEPGGELPASQPQPTTAETLLDEKDLLIEEYDSD